MTTNFSAKNRVADSKFASVYKCFLPDGKIVAVKHLKQGALEQAFFLSEIHRIKSLTHPNLISLLGYCSTGGFQTLVSEFAQNKHLSHHLHGKSPLLWDDRVKVATGVAHALIYLHDRGVIHRDVKPSNILLNENFEAQVADFGCTQLSLPYLWTRKIGYSDAIPSPHGPEEAYFTQRQESTRKDIECVFGKFKKKWAVIRRPSRFHNTQIMGEIVNTCVILHNMIIHGHCKYGERDYVPDEVSREVLYPYGSVEYNERLQYCRNVGVGKALKKDLVAHLWNHKQNDGL